MDLLLGVDLEVLWARLFALTSRVRRQLLLATTRRDRVDPGAHRAEDNEHNDQKKEATYFHSYELPGGASL